MFWPNTQLWLTTLFSPAEQADKHYPTQFSIVERNCHHQYHRLHPHHQEFPMLFYPFRPHFIGCDKVDGPFRRCPRSLKVCKFAVRYGRGDAEAAVQLFVGWVWQDMKFVLWLEASDKGCVFIIAYFLKNDFKMIHLEMLPFCTSLAFPMRL